MNKIGIIQGRLSKRPYPRLQEFPWNTWQEEFEYAKRIGYDFIEWIFELNRFEDNPIWTSEGRKEINRRKNNGVSVDSVCADYFLEKPFYRRKEYSLEQNINILKELIKKIADIDARTILLPVLEEAELRTGEEEKELAEALYQCIPLLEEYKIKIGLETELDAHKYLDVVSQFKSDCIGVYYDAGNCTFCGHDMKEDMEVLKDYIFNIHVKDRKIGGESVYLGTGDTNFREGIPYLIQSGFKGNFVLQTYFEDNHLEEAAKNIGFIKGLIVGD